MSSNNQWLVETWKFTEHPEMGTPSPDAHGQVMRIGLGEVDLCVRFHSIAFPAHLGELWWTG